MIRKFINCKTEQNKNISGYEKGKRKDSYPEILYRNLEDNSGLTIIRHYVCIHMEVLLSD